MVMLMDRVMVVVTVVVGLIMIMIVLGIQRRQSELNIGVCSIIVQIVRVHL